MPKKGELQRPLDSHHSLLVHMPEIGSMCGAVRCCKRLAVRFPSTERVFADAGYASERVSTATRIAVEIVIPAFP